MFSIGDKVVYPMHGAGIIESIEEKEMFGDTADYYIIKMPMGDITLSVPINSALDVGVRDVSAANIAKDVFKVLEKPKVEYIHETNWSKKYKTNVDKIKTGDILEVADVVRELSHRNMERGLSTGEKKMLHQAKEILISELVLAQNLDHQKIDEDIEALIKTSYDMGNVNISNEIENT